MTDSKKRLKEILKKILWFSPYDTNRESKNAKQLDKTTTEILKEFVHKDNLPSIKEIGNLILKELLKTDEYVDGDNIDTSVIIDGDFDLKIIAIAIRELIEGKKW